jgi:hypothetical protein
VMGSGKKGGDVAQAKVYILLRLCMHSIYGSLLLI